MTKLIVPLLIRMGISLCQDTGGDLRIGHAQQGPLTARPSREDGNVSPIYNDPDLRCLAIHRMAAGNVNWVILGHLKILRITSAPRLSSCVPCKLP